MAVLHIWNCYSRPICWCQQLFNNMFRLLLLIFILQNLCVDSLHLQGSWNSSHFFTFLAKFGFQKTDSKDHANSQGYIYGNITSNSNVSAPLTFVVVDREYFLQYYKNRKLNSSKACPAMFSKIDTIAYDSECFDDGVEDFLRKIPCPKNKLCEDEDVSTRVVPGFQFTFGVQDLAQPRFWYISIVSCYRPQQGAGRCMWTNSNRDIIIDYDIWIVNGNPFTPSNNIFEYQFSFDNQDTVEIFLVFFVLYIILVPIQLYAQSKQRHRLTKLFTISMLLELLGIFFVLIHLLKFATDGEGVDNIRTLGTVCDMMSQCLFILLLLLIAKGWTITRNEINCKLVLFGVWTLYSCVHVLLFVWNRTEVDVIEDIDEYQTWPGWLILVFRLFIMVWFLFELRSTFLTEHFKGKLQFYLHFGAGFLVWFVHLPVVALVALSVSALWRYKLLLSITYAADFLAFAVLTHLLWPSRSEQYFCLQYEADHCDELEEFEENPHLSKKSIALT